MGSTTGDWQLPLRPLVPSCECLRHGIERSTDVQNQAVCLEIQIHLDERGINLAHPASVMELSSKFTRTISPAIFSST
jgi:hypothetical protein